MVKNITAICKLGGFNLTKWISNSREVLLEISEEQRSKNFKELDLDRDKLPVERALGLHWCIETDAFKFKFNIREQPHTRRGMLSMISSVYDPLGFLAPFTIPAKIILQDLCRLKCGWDDSVPQSVQQKWNKWMEDLESVGSFKVSRCLKPKDFGHVISAQLHHFSDASESAYGTVTYIRLQNSKNQVHIAFVLGKARVAPLKQVTIPRLELTAATVAVKVDKMLSSELQLPLEEPQFWTDSTSVLKYIKNEDKRFQTFVANRISVIREASQVSQWRYIPSAQNPADDASRGLKFEHLTRE
ncbi:uncharacterized protein LOC134107160 [Pungitius pungitius]|uniref:uncharacterized protein LOC134107138 n=1 Tax=Pungitius pungitius TaxID=134920 RepID=UPI002E150A18